MRLSERRSLLEALLLETAPLWQASTFHQRRPAWCMTYPGLTDALLALDDATLADLNADAAKSADWLASALPVMESLSTLTDLSGAENAAPREASPAAVFADTQGQATAEELPPVFAGAGSHDHSAPSNHRVVAGAKANRDIPGRKVGQIDAFVAAVGQPVAPLVEWCAGKGHLGRRFLINWGGEALAVERNAALCASGEVLAREVRPTQRFMTADVMAAATAESLRGAHAVALHACGDLHRRLVVAAAEVRAPAIDLAPCCYQLTAAETYQPLLAHSALKLDRVALKLAVTETVTASPREAANSAQASAWKLAFLNLREQLLPTAAYQPFRPVPSSWQGEGFAGFLSRLAEREALPLPAGLDLLACEAAGWQRHHESRRLQLVRMAFRRAIEIWLLCDLAGWLEKQGYAVTLREFCARSLTPRNLLLSARLL